VSNTSLITTDGVQMNSVTFLYFTLQSGYQATTLHIEVRMAKGYFRLACSPKVNRWDSAKWSL